MITNLDTLRKTAEAATPGPWEKHDLPVAVANSNFTIHAPNAVGVPTWTTALPPEIASTLKAEDAKFIATFDPPTVLALLSRLEQAEQAVKRKQSALDTVARIVETQCEAVVLATDSQDLIGDDLDGDWDAVWGRLSELADQKRTAEQAVQRVREMATELRDTPASPESPKYARLLIEGAQAAGADILRALDGDGRG